ncbi:hypothetical protein CRM93_13605 [Acetobacter fabarum]|uniref:MobA/VirD2-like nuclease domain-containing protein n=2 Tax=Acetobacter fabarum TaxID=483199 RepID=A0A269XVC7_9PROT|nr:hypothetical protein B8X00_13120 [Acetobacter fabarum]PEN21921.1 hypothetical protein CRM93_13605 [Acetobacter fabarum]
MIGKQSRIASNGSPHKFIRHIFHGPMNEKIRVIRGGEFSVHGAFDDARGAGKSYAIRHIVLSGKEDMSEADALELLNDYAQEFGFDPDDVSLVEHTKRRQNGAGSERHYHIAVPELQSDGHVISSSWMRPRNEKICRAFEVRHGLEIVPGKFNKAVVRARPDLAEAMQNACEGERPGEAYSTATHQKMLSKGKKTPEIKSEILGMWNGNIEELRSSLLEKGYSIECGDKKPDAYVIRDIDGDIVGSVARILKIKQKEFATLYREWEAGHGVEFIREQEAPALKAPIQKEDEQGAGHGPIPARDASREEGISDHADADNSGHGEGSRDHIIGADRQRWNGGNSGYPDKAEGRPAGPALRDQSVIGNDSETAKPDDTAYKRFAVVRLSTLKVLPKPAVIITKEDARRTWELASKPRKTPEEYQHLRRSYDNMNNLGFGLIFKTPEAGIKYASKVLAGLIVEVFSNLAQGFKLAFFGGPIEPGKASPKVGQITRDVRRNVLPEVYDIYAKAYDLLTYRARTNNRKLPSRREFIRLMKTADPLGVDVERKLLTGHLNTFECEQNVRDVIQQALSGQTDNLENLTGFDADRINDLAWRNMGGLIDQTNKEIMGVIAVLNPKPAPVQAKELALQKTEELEVEKFPEPILLPEVTPAPLEDDQMQVVTEKPKSPTPVRKDPSPF